MIKAKKFIAALLCLILCLSFCPTVFAAENSTPVISLSNKTAMSGETVTIDIDISNNPGIMAMAFCITYDSDALEYVNYTKGYLSSYTIKDHPDKGHVSFVNIENANVATNGTMLSVAFTVKESASAGKYIISLANSNRDKYGNNLENSFSQQGEKFVVPKVISGSITVDETCENSGHKYGEWRVTREADCYNTGLKNRICSRCNQVEEVEIPITHDFEEEWTVDKAATPQEDGIMSRHCKSCDEVTDRITFTYKEVEDSENNENTDNTSSDASTGGTASDVDSSNTGSSGSNTSGASGSSSTASSGNTTINNTVINNTEGARNPLSAVENLKDYQESIKPNLENTDQADSNTSSVADKSDSSADTQSTDGSSEADITETQADDLDDEPQISNSFLTTPTGIAITVLSVLISAAVIALAIILIIRRKKSE